MISYFLKFYTNDHGTTSRAPARALEGDCANETTWPWGSSSSCRPMVSGNIFDRSNLFSFLIPNSGPTLSVSPLEVFSDPQSQVSILLQEL